MVIWQLAVRICVRGVCFTSLDGVHIHHLNMSTFHNHQNTGERVLLSRTLSTWRNTYRKLRAHRSLDQWTAPSWQRNLVHGTLTERFWPYHLCTNAELPTRLEELKGFREVFPEVDGFSTYTSPSTSNKAGIWKKLYGLSLRPKRWGFPPDLRSAKKIASNKTPVKPSL